MPLKFKGVPDKVMISVIVKHRLKVKFKLANFLVRNSKHCAIVTLTPAIRLNHEITFNCGKGSLFKHCRSFPLVIYKSSGKYAYIVIRDIM